MLKPIIFIFFSLMGFQSSAQSNHQTIQVETKNDTFYKYHQIAVNTSLGLVGSITLNGNMILDFDNRITQLSRNLDFKHLKDGENKLELVITNVTADFKLGYFDEAGITMVYHCINEKVFPSKESEFFKILWSPEEKQTKVTIEYLFNLNLE